MKLRLKEGVVLDGIDHRMLMALESVAYYAERLGLKELVVTSARDGVHSKGSLHPKGLALDFRTKTIKTKEGKLQFHRDIADDLLEFDVLLEDLGRANEHLHVEYDPR